MNRQPETRPPKRSERNNHLTGSANLALLDDAIGTIVRKALRAQAFRFRKEIKQFKTIITSLKAQLEVQQSLPRLAQGPTIQKLPPPITWSLHEQIPLTQEDPSPKVRKKCRKRKKKVKPSEPCLIQPSVSLLAHTESDDDPYIQKLRDAGWRVDELFEFCQQTGQDPYAFFRKLKANDQIFLQLYQDSTAQEIGTIT
eukprot:TRINITY_DN522_c0_g1_i8.p1 TRINITY_DN522_c0_g1~~TRINITY_DN522_c0_g1_i8.p1  ORF type:complete len:198 (-),score=13.13 TRINITY_DN522_c0_g1_i8:203-796(-)